MSNLKMSYVLTLCSRAIQYDGLKNWPENCPHLARASTRDFFKNSIELPPCAARMDITSHLVKNLQEKVRYRRRHQRLTRQIIRFSTSSLQSSRHSRLTSVAAAAAAAAAGARANWRLTRTSSSMSSPRGLPPSPSTQRSPPRPLIARGRHCSSFAVQNTHLLPLVTLSSSSSSPAQSAMITY